MATLVIAAEGPNAKDATAVAADFFKKEFGAEAELHIAKSSETERFLEHIDPNWISAVFTVPSGVLASIELNQRFQLIERTSSMLAEIRRRLGNAGGSFASVRPRPSTSPLSRSSMRFGVRTEAKLSLYQSTAQEPFGVPLLNVARL